MPRWPAEPHPNSLRALEAHRSSVADRPKCRYCRAPAIKGVAVCRHHGGYAAAYSAGHPVRPKNPAVAEHRAAMRKLRTMVVPAELERLPVWRQLFNGRRNGVLLTELLYAWEKLTNDGDAESWTTALRRAEDAARDRGREPFERRVYAR